MLVRRIDPASGVVSHLRDIDKRLRKAETGPSGVVVVNQQLITIDPTTQVSAVFGALPDGTSGFQPYIGDTTPPNQPSAPVVTSPSGILAVSWNGLDYLGGIPPKDYDRTIVEMNTASATATSGWTKADEMRGKGVIYVSSLTASATGYFRLVSLDYNQNRSVPSTVVQGIVSAISSDSSVASALNSLSAQVSSAQATANGKNTVYYSNVQPSGGTYQKGDLWFDTAHNNKLYTYDGSAWQLTQDSSTALTTAQGKNQTFVAATAPVANAVGDLWIDSSNGYRVNRWSGTAWVNVQDTAIATAQTAANNAQTSANSAQTTANGKNQTFTSATAPVANAVGDLWLDSSNGYRVNRWSGSAWVNVQDTAIATAQTAANNAQTSANTAQTTANGKNQTFVAATAPTAQATGDIWIDSSNGYRQNRWNGSSWVNVQDTAISTAQSAATAAQTTANGKNTSYYQPSQPSGGTYKQGDLWFNTAQNYQLSTYTGSVWQLTQDSNSAYNAAVSKGKVWFQSTAPDGGNSYAWTGAADASTSTWYVSSTLTSTNLVVNPSFEAASGTVNVRTNMVTNPNFETNTTGWSANTGSPTLTSDTTYAFVGTHSLKAASTVSSTDVAVLFTATLGGSTTYTLSYYVYSPNACTASFDIAGTGYTPSGNGTTSIPVNAWTRVSATFTTPSTAPGSTTFYLHQKNLPSTIGTSVWIDAVLLESSGQVGTYFDGNTAAAGDFAYAWSGAANGSTSYQQAPGVANWNLRGYGGSGGSGATYLSKGTALLRNYVLRKLWKTANTGSAQDAGINTPNIPVTPGATYTSSISMRPTITATATTLCPYIIWLDSGSNTISNTSTSGVSAPNGVWTRASVTATAPANAAYATFVFGPYGGASTMAAGDYLDFDSCLVQQASSLNAYFDGATPSDRAYDLWVNTAQGNKMYQWDEPSRSWLSAQDAAIGTAQTTANGKNTVYYSGTAPSGGTYTVNDVWFNTSAGNQIAYWSGSAWVVAQFGASAIANASITNAQIANGTIGTAQIGSLDAGKITTGTLSANVIGAATIAASALAAGAVTANAISAGAVGAQALAANSVTATAIAANTIVAGNGIVQSLDAGTITVGTLNAARIGAKSISVDKLLVGDRSDFVVDPYFSDSQLLGSSGTTAYGTTYLTSNSAVPTGAPAVPTVLSLPTGGYDYFTGDWFAIVPGDQYYVEGWAVNPSGSTTLGLGLWCADSRQIGGNNYSPVGITSTAANSRSWTKVSGYITIPSTTNTGPSAVAPQWGRVWVAMGNGVGWWLTGFHMRRKNGGELIIDGSIIASKIAAGAITAGALSAGAVSATAIAANTITGAQLAAGSVSATAIAANTITAGQIAANTITAGQIAAGTITASQIAANTITGAQLAAGSVSATAIAANTITAGQIAANTITAGQIAAGTITATQLAAGSVTATQIAAGSIVAGNGIVSSLDAGTISVGTLNAARIGAKTITTDKLVVGSMDNLISEPSFAAGGVAWATGGQYSIDPTGSRSGGTAWKIACNGTKLGAYNLPNDLPVSDNNSYRFYAWIKSDTSIPVTGVNLYVKTRSTSGTYTETIVVSSSATASGTWTLLSGVYTMPTNTVSASFGVFTGTNMSSGNVWVDSVFVARMSNGELIVDGSITANSIAANAITAGKINAGAIDGMTITGAVINGGLIQTTSASGSAVSRMSQTAVKDAVNSGSSSYPGVGFGVVGASTIMAGIYSTDGDGLTVAGGNGGSSGMNYHTFIGNNQTIYSYGGIGMSSRGSVTISAGVQGAAGAQAELTGGQIWISNSTPYNGTIGGIRIGPKQFGVSHAEMYVQETGVPVNTVWGPGQPTLSSSAGTAQNSIDAPSLYHWASNDHMVVDQAGFFTFFWLASYGSAVNGYSYLSLENSSGGIYGRVNIAAGEFAGSLAVPDLYLPSGTTVVWHFLHNSSGSQTVSHILKVRWSGLGVGQF